MLGYSQHCFNSNCDNSMNYRYTWWLSCDLLLYTSVSCYGIISDSSCSTITQEDVVRGLNNAHSVWRLCHVKSHHSAHSPGASLELYSSNGSDLKNTLDTTVHRLVNNTWETGAVNHALHRWQHHFCVLSRNSYARANRCPNRCRNRCGSSGFDVTSDVAADVTASGWSRWDCQSIVRPRPHFCSYKHEHCPFWRAFDVFLLETTLFLTNTCCNLTGLLTFLSTLLVR